MLGETIAIIFNISLFHSVIRSSTPILFAALAASLSQQSNILNIGVEGLMLITSFTAVCISYYTHSWLFAILISMLAGGILSIIMGFFHINKRVDIFVLGMLMNLFALAVTKYLMPIVFNTTGIFTSPKIVAIPNIELGITNNIISEIFDNYNILELLGPVLTLILTFILFQTIWGLRVRCIGLLPAAAETAGIDANKIRYQTLFYSGLISGMGGAYLSLGYSTIFVENMTNGRGFMGVAAMFFGNANPIKTWLATLIFGFSDSIGARLQSFDFPSQIVLIFPYITTVVVLSMLSFYKIYIQKNR